jgi:hypothetical protein
MHILDSRHTLAPTFCKLSMIGGCHYGLLAPELQQYAVADSMPTWLVLSCLQRVFLERSGLAYTPVEAAEMSDLRDKLKQVGCMSRVIHRSSRIAKCS